MEATTKRLIGVISTAVLSLAIAVPAYAQEQHDQQEEQKAKPAQEEKKAQPEKPAAQQTDKNAKQEDKNTQQENKNKNQEEKSAQQQDKNNQQEQRNAQQENRNTQQENRNAQQRSQQAGQEKGRIPAERYQANFGREHTFRVTQGDYRNHRFEYGGYSFAFVDAWPSNWLYTQDLYVIDINGVYYLCNPMYPGINVAISVTL